MTHNTIYGPRRRMLAYLLLMGAALTLVLAASGLGVCMQALIAACACVGAACARLSATM